MIQFITNKKQEAIDEALLEINDRLQVIQRILNENGEGTLEHAAEYQTKGADFKRKESMAAVEKYFSSLKYLPQSEKVRIVKAAHAEQNNEFIEELKNAISNLAPNRIHDTVYTNTKESVSLKNVTLNFDKDVIENEAGEWVAAPAVVESIIKENQTTLTAEEEQELNLFKRFLALFKELDEKKYYWHDFAGNDLFAVYFDCSGLTDDEIAAKIYTKKNREG